MATMASSKLRVKRGNAPDDMTPGDFFEIAPGHDAWVLGDDRCVLVDFAGNVHYAEPPRPPGERPQPPGRRAP